MFHNNGVSNSELQSVLVADHNAASRTSSGWWNLRVSSCAAVTSMDEEISSATHLAGLLRVKIEGAGPGHSVVHHIFAIGDFVLGSWQWTGVDHTLLVRIHVSFSLSAVSMGVDGIIARTSHQFTCFLIVGEGHWEPGWEIAAAVLGTGLVGSNIIQNGLDMAVLMMISVESIHHQPDCEDCDKEIFVHGKYYYGLDQLFLKERCLEMLNNKL